MKISTQWLRDYCELDLSADELADCLARRGMEIESVTPIGNDFCIDIEVTANRPDLLGHIGIAREVAAHLGLPLRIPDVSLPESGRDVAELARVEVHNPELCSRYTARVLYDVAVGPAPAEMQRRLEVIGLRPVNNVVDITNYVLMECGQPEHAFDFGRLDGACIVVRRARDGEGITLIDGTTLELTSENLVIADSSRPVALAGIMGGLATEIGPATSTVLLESARFDPVNSRRSTRSTGQSSDSSYRFERSVDVPTVEWASRRAAALLVEHAGAQVARGMVDVDFTQAETRTIRLRIPRIEAILGLAVPAPRAGQLLKAIGFGVRPQGHDALDVTVPTFRPDVALEIDLIEEVARCEGYDKVPAIAPLPTVAVTDSRESEVCRVARETLVRLGYVETVTTTFLSEELARTFSPWTHDAPLCVTNPLRSDEAALRPSLVPSLLEVKRVNQDRGNRSVRIFEANRVYLNRPGDERLPKETNCLTVLADEDFHVLKGSVEELLERLGVLERVALEASREPFLSAGAAASLLIGQHVVGHLGEVADEAVALFGLRHNPCVCELDLDTLVANASLERRYREIPRFPHVVRDVAIVVNEKRTWDDIRATVEEAGVEHLESVTFHEVYHGEQIERGKKSVMFSIVYRAADRTLTNEEVNASQDVVVGALAQELGAVLRA